MNHPDVERAIYFRDVKLLPRAVERRYSRLYFGTEFCERLIPSYKEMGEVVSFAAAHRKTFTLVTPHCTDEGIRKSTGLLELLPAGSEVVFNDWGMLEAVREKNLVPVCGRLLIAIERDPRIGADHGPASKGFRTSSLSAGYFSGLLLSKGISRVELDDVKQGYDFTPREAMRISLHYPFVYITTSRKCIVAQSSSPPLHDKIAVGGSCSYECADTVIEASVGGCTHRVLLKGNSQFYQNKNDEPEHLYPGVDRIVYCPELPFPFSPQR